MPEISKTTRTTYRDRDDYDSDDDARSTFSRSRAGGDGAYRTVQRYRVTPSRVEEVDIDARSSRSRLDIAPRAERIEIDRRSFIEPERPRSTIGIGPRSTVVERYVEREPTREPVRERERTVVYEREDRERRDDFNRPWERHNRPWENMSVRGDEREADVKIEKRVERVERREEPFSDVRVEKRVTERREEPHSPREREVERDVTMERTERREEYSPREVERDVRVERTTVERREEPYELERYKRETEYYDRPEPPPAPIIIRQRAPEPQRIIVQEAPTPPPIILPPREENLQIVKQEIKTQDVARPEPRRQQDEEYYYRRDVREIGPGRELRRDDREEEFALNRREVRPRDSVSDGEYSDGSEYVVRRKVIRREQRSRSGSPHHRRHLAEGALAGAGAAALLASHARKTGDGDGGHRGRKVVGGAALGAIGAEVLTRARSRYRESRDSRSRSRSSSRHSHRKIKTALGLAAAGLAAAAAAKYVSNRRQNQEEYGRGRSRTRSASRGRHYSDYESDYNTRARSQSRHTSPKHRAASIAKAGAATAAVAGVVEHFRNKSRKRSGERSKSRIRTGAEIAGAGLAGAAVAGLYENRKAKEESQADAEDYQRRQRRRSESRTRSRSRARSVATYSDPGVDPELGMVQYGTEPVYTHQTTTTYQRGYDNYDPALAGGAAAAAATYGATRSRSRSRRQSRRSSSSSRSPKRERSRSRSRMRDIAGVAAGTAAAAIGVNQYKKRKEKKEAERERERRRYEEEEEPPENYYARQQYSDDGYPPSPPRASGGGYPPENNQFHAHPPAQPGFTQHATTSTMHVNTTGIPPYNPQDYANQPPPAHGTDPYGYPPRTGDNVSENNDMPHQTPFAPSPVQTESTILGGGVPYFPPPPTAPLSDEHLETARNPEEGYLERLRTPSTVSPSSSPPMSPSRPSNKSVMFAPLSPTSSRSLARIHKTAEATDSGTHIHEDSPEDRVVHFEHPIPPKEVDVPSDRSNGRRRRRRRRNSDPSSDRPNQPSKHRRRQHNASRSPSPDDGEVEVLPDRFDRDGRPLDRYGNAYHSSGYDRDATRGRDDGGHEMIERFTNQIGDVMEGRKSWMDLLRGFVDDAGGIDSREDLGGGSSSSGSRRRRRRD